MVQGARWHTARRHPRLLLHADGSPMTVAVRAAHVSKTYRLHRERRRTFTDIALRQLAAPEEVHALREVTFAVHLGEAFGVVGANRSRKSRLLQLIRGTANPTT